MTCIDINKVDTTLTPGGLVSLASSDRTTRRALEARFGRPGAGGKFIVTVQEAKELMNGGPGE